MDPPLELLLCTLLFPLLYGFQLNLTQTLLSGAFSFFSVSYPVDSNGKELPVLEVTAGDAITLTCQVPPGALVKGVSWLKVISLYSQLLSHSCKNDLFQP